MTILKNIAKTVNIILAFLLLVAVAYITFLYFNPKIEKVYLQTKPEIKIVYVEKANGTVVASKTIPAARDASELINLEKTKEMYEHLIPEIRDYKKQVAVLAEVKSTLEGQLTEKDIIINNLKTKNPNSTTWQSEYLTITHSPDSNKIDYKYNNTIQLAIARATNDSLKVVASSPDKNNKINGLDTYVQAFRIPKRFSELVLDASLGKLNFNKDLSGLKLEGKLKWKFNPDGVFRPYIFVGTESDFMDVVYPMGLGAEYRIK